jgi:predicted O-methyltransferase YrrM
MRLAVRRSVFGLLILALASVAPAVSRVTIAQDSGDESLEAFREGFLRDFDRIGMNSPHEDALFLRILIQGMEAWQGLEIGSANGYGAIHMGIGFERHGGTLTTLDIDPRMVHQCRDNVARAKLDEVVACLEGDALKLIPTLEGEFDFVFIDARKEDYLRYLKAVEPKLAPGAVIVAHNAVAFAGAMWGYLDHVGPGGDYDTVIVRTNDQDGMAVSYRKR